MEGEVELEGERCKESSELYLNTQRYKTSECLKYNGCIADEIHRRYNQTGQNTRFRGVSDPFSGDVSGPDPARMTSVTNAGSPMGRPPTMIPVNVVCALSPQVSKVTRVCVLECPDFGRPSLIKLALSKLSLTPKISSAGSASPTAAARRRPLSRLLRPSHSCLQRATGHAFRRRASRR